MTQINDRKEPTFGKPNDTTVTPTATEQNVETAKVSFSLHSNKSPGYTFTPVMKRPAATTEQLSNQEKTIEEQAMNKNQGNPVESVAPVTSNPQNNGGFAFAPVKEDSVASVNTASVEQKADVEPPKVVAANPNIERVIPNVANATKEKVAKVPSKYRRLLIVLLLLLALLLAIFLLKPKTPETVESLQEQGSSLPIEFRPVNEEEAKRAEAEAKALQEQAQAQGNTQTPTQNTETNVSANLSETENSSSSQTVGSDNTPSVSASESVQQLQNSQEAANLPVVKPVFVEPVKKPEVSGSVIHQPETMRKDVTAVSNKPAQVTKVEAKPTPAKQPVVTKVEKVTVTPSSEKSVAKQPVKVTENKASVSNSASVSSKTLTVPKGVSLMQVFRNHQLNISDVNAMSKVNNIVSNLKVGEKVTVHLDKNGRVTEMKIGSGGRFIRQADGSYIYK